MSTPFRFVALVSPLFTTFVATAGTAQTQPAANAQAGRGSASTQPVTEGSVQEAMHRLFTIPRPKTSREMSHAASTNQKRANDLPYSRVLPGPDPDPSSRADTRPRTSSSPRIDRAGGLPTDEEIRRALPNRVAPASPDDLTHGGTAAAAWRRNGPGYGVRGPAYGPGFNTYSPFFGSAGRYGNAGFGSPYGPAYGDPYAFGFIRWFNYWNWYDESNARTDRILKNYSGHLAKALEFFNKGLYIEAADAFQLACDTHQGDPAARLYTAHSLFAIGRYRDAVPYLRRAFDLQPRVIFLGFDIRDDYGRKSDFDLQRAALEAALRQSPNNLDRLVLLGYVLYFSRERERAYPLLRMAYRLDHNDRFVIALLENSRPPDVMLESSSKQ